jgi:predicted RNA binding protein YcfA (HicA-like mRNA interferase family)
MTMFPRVTGKERVAALQKAGLQVIRTKGSHQFLGHDDGKTSVVPVYAGETVGPGLLSKIPPRQRNEARADRIAALEIYGREVYRRIGADAALSFR